MPLPTLPPGPEQDPRRQPQDIIDEAQSIQIVSSLLHLGGRIAMAGLSALQSVWQKIEDARQQGEDKEP